jgi:hypothetical protein
VGGLAAALALLAAAAGLSSCGGGDSSGPVSLAPAKVVPPEYGSTVVRIPGRSPADVAGAALLATHSIEQPSGWIVVRQDKWRTALIGAQFAADPVGAALLPAHKDYFSSGAYDMLLRITPTGFPRGQGLETLLLDKVGQDVLIDLQDRELKFALLSAKSPAKLANDAVPFRGGWAAKYSPEIVVASSERVDYALPAAAWSAYSGDSLAYVSSKGIPQPTIEMLTLRKGVTLQTPNIYVVGPPSVIPDAIVSQLAAYGNVTRIAGDTAAETSVAMARFRDPSTGFGWGFKRGPVNVSLVNSKHWADAIGAFAYAARGPRAPLIVIPDGKKLPIEVIRFLRDMRSGDPSHGFVFGDQKSISTDALKQLDAVLNGRS